MVTITSLGMASVFNGHEGAGDVGSCFLGSWSKLDGGLRGVSVKKGRLTKCGQRKPGYHARDHRGPRGLAE